MTCADARVQKCIAEAEEFLAQVPGAICLVRQDDYFTLLWANARFYDLVGIPEDEMGFRYANRISALWDAEGVARIARLARSGGEGGIERFRHRLIGTREGFLLETQATLLSEVGVLCCLSRDCSREAAAEAQLQRFEEMSLCVADTTGLEVFSYDARTKAARVLYAASVLEGLASPYSIVEDFPAMLVQSGRVHPDDEQHVLSAFEASLAQGARSSHDLRLGGADPETGRWRWYRLTLAGCANSFLPGGATGGGVLMDITEHKELTISYLNETQFYYALLSEKDAYGHADITDDAILKIGGMWNLYNELISTMSYTEVVETFIGRVVHPDDRAHYLDVMRRENFIESLENGIDHVGCEFRRIVEQNKMAWMELSVHLLKDPITHHVLALLSIKNVDKKKRQELQLQSASQRDPLTQVLHKKAAEDAIRARLQSTASHDVGALLVFDIDDFKSINDRWGHKVGDKALERFVHEVRCLTGQDDVLGRFGGDEFVLFVANAFDKEHVSCLVKSVYDRIAAGNGPLFTCSTGVALMSYGMGYDEGFRRADKALYEAKAAGKATFRFYDDADDEGAGSSTFAYERLKRAASNGDAIDGEAEAGVSSGEKACAQWGEGDRSSFAEFLSHSGDMAYLVDPDTFTLICGNESFYDRIGETDASCMGKKCYEVMQGRETPCPFCSKANWSTDKFFIWRNDNKALDQEFLIKNKLVSWYGREVLLAIAVDVSNNKSIVDSLDSDISEDHYLLGGIQQMYAAHDLAEVIDRALESIGGFFRADGARFWSEGDDGACKCEVTWSREPGAFLPIVPDGRALVDWLAAQSWDEPVMVESPEAVLRSSYPMYRFMKDNGLKNERWIRLQDNEDTGKPCYISVENLNSNLENVAFLESFSVFLASEISRRRMMEDLLHVSSHDELTGLLNRESYERRVDSFDGDRARCVGVVSANVNDMKLINGTKGFAAGNYYLKQFAAMLLDVFPPDDVYRLNGDEFAVIALDLDREALEGRMRDLRAMVQSNGLFSVAVGYSWDEVERDLGLLTAQAVEAMEADKSRHHELRQDLADDRRMALRNLVEALGDGRFVVYLQPKVRLSDERVVGAEALIRYRDPETGIVPPARFIQGLEDSGLIRHVDLFVFEWVCQVVEHWEREGAALPVSLNLSRRTLLENDLIPSMRNIVSHHELDRRNLEVEITESFATIGKSVLYQAANDMLDAGFSLSLDDFGTKYTDLSILSSIDFAVIKLDKSLIDAIVEDHAKQTVLKHIISMCGELHVDVIAEGIETVEQKRVLQSLGCQYGQGYLFGRPMPLEDFERAFMGEAE